jgi:DNA polymerase I-like protein with 3'-5' exonuclease and polymerase domains
MDTEMIGFDTETTGLDIRHGAEPFLVTTCNSNNMFAFWEWDVDPLTRKVQANPDDLKDIQELIESPKVVSDLVLQNPKFDVAAMASVIPGLKWPWERTWDTLLAGHLLSSSRPHDLTTMVLQYLGIDVKPFDRELEVATKEARRMARSEYPDWRIAKKGLPEMPSVSAKLWKNDTWLPRAIAKEKEYDDDHPWWTVCSKYANTDSITTLALFTQMEKELKERNLWAIYLERLKLLPLIYQMEGYGITLSRDRLEEIQEEYREESEIAGRKCLNISQSLGYKLELPKSGNNKSLTEFVFDGLSLEPQKVSKKTGEPSLDKTVMEYYEVTLPQKSKGYHFIKSLGNKRKRDTALSYLEGYQKYWHAIDSNDWYRLHPSLNPTGSRTLRWSSQYPNEQNISKKEGFNLRYAFGPAPGREWWALDYDNLELRIPAYECQEPAMLKLFENPTEPPYYGSYHLLVFDILHPTMFAKHGVDVKNKFKSTWYQWTKNGNFAELYGAIETSGTADKAYHVPGAQRRVAKYLTKKAELNQYWIDYANENGYVETMPDRSIPCGKGDPRSSGRGYPIECPVNQWGKISPTIPFNYHVQGTACWVMMRAMIKVQEYLEGLDRDYRMIMNVHDEIVLDFPFRKNRGNLPKIRKVRSLMESCGKDINVPLTCGIDYHPDNWSVAA